MERDGVEVAATKEMKGFQGFVGILFGDGWNTVILARGPEKFGAPDELALNGSGLGNRKGE